MSTYPPKLDKARREWLAGLKDRDEAALVGPRSTPRPIRLNVFGRGDHRRVRGGNHLNFGKSGKALVNPWQSAELYIVPLTDEVRQAQRLRDLRARVVAHDFGAATNEQIEAIAKVLGWDGDSTRGGTADGQ